jgi:protein-L-isoaspartate(D-aspartate) O-methyltransferase
MPASPTRTQMIEQQLQDRGIREPRILHAFMEVPREVFVDKRQQAFAYRDTPLPIADGQTISQPYIVALTAQALHLEGWERVLEVGTGSGYAAAILSHLARRVFTVERHALLAELAKTRLAALSLDNVRVACADGTLGWPEHSPFDAIAVAASAPSVPPSLRSQLKVGGRLVIPVGAPGQENLLRVTRHSETNFDEEVLCPVSFVPLIGKQGWPDMAH